MNPVGLQSGRSLWPAAAIIVGLLWPALAAAQDWSHHGEGRGPEQTGGRGAAPKPYAAPRSHSQPGSRPGGYDRPYRPTYGRWAPGQVLPPSAAATVVFDYERFHLRRPPRGYTWLQYDNDFILTNAAGLIFEAIPSGGR